MSATYTMHRPHATHILPLRTTAFGLAVDAFCANARLMVFDRYQFLERVLEKAPTRQAVLDVLGLPSSRGPNMFNRGHDRPRRLWVEEAVKLSEKFDVPLTGGSVSAEDLTPVLSVALRGAPTDWQESDVQRLAEEVAFGLRLQQSFPPSLQTPDRPATDAGEEGASPRYKSV